MSKKAKQDVIICAVIYAFMAFCFWQTLSMKSGSEVMPQMILGLATICNTILLVRSLGELKKNIGDDGYTTFSEVKVPLLMFLGVVLYCAIFAATNYFIATAILIFVFMMIEKIKPLWLILLIDALYLSFIYVLFIMVLKVPLLK